MGDITWIKLKTDMFENEKIKLIEALPDADTIIIIWVKLLSYAGRANAGGYIMLTENVPMTTEEMATIFNRPLNTVRLALETFRRYRMIEMNEDQVIRIKNWDVYQNLEGMEKVKEQNRLRKRKQRERDKQLPEPPVPEQDDSSGHVTSRDSHATDIDKELDKEKENTSCRKNKFSDEHMAMANLLLSLIKENNPNYKSPKSLDKWANDMRLMMERDKRTKEQVEYLIRWSQKDDFWSTVILSPNSLRKGFDKMVARCRQESRQKQNR
ncbi:phage replisome organizer N-terminal domain-containing protein, partial [Sporolactobacillus terrae]|uniref:phage replisome organizer N-terminal domain-containing protein n=1 Tax=Sporolactobacillus terrae TaxID=269673 RepID=UPI00055B018E